MSNPFDNVPSSANVPEVPDKKDVANLAELVSRFEDATRCFEASAKSSEELAGAVFEALLDEDGTMKDFGARSPSAGSFFMTPFLNSK